jgi:lipopolysaccharide/colanic/teichoic acid biosynthesis glycosyltransferase
MKRLWVRSLHAVGIAGLLVGARFAYTEILGPARYGTSNTASAGWWIALAGLLIGSSYGLGLPEMPRRRGEALARGLGAALVSIGAVSMVQLVGAETVFPRSTILLVATIVPLWSVLTWNVAADLHSWSSSRDRVMLITDRMDDVAALVADLDARQEIGATLVDVVSIAEARVSRNGREPLIERVAESQPTVIVIDRAAQNDDSIVAQISRLHRSGVRVRTLALFYEGWLGKLPVAELAQVSMLFDIGEVHRANYVRSKRVLDAVVGTIGSALCLALTPFIYCINLGANRGPLFFTQERIGKDGEPFRMYKFRTMTEAHGDNSTWTTDGDLRITPFGNLLRKLHLDELPQMVNILRGELSIVGPRPEQTHYVEELRSKIPFYDERHIVRPGLTGWAQVKLGYTATDGDALEKLQYDFYYLRRQSISFDLRIVGRTVREVVGGLGR